MTPIRCKCGVCISKGVPHLIRHCLRFVLTFSLTHRGNLHQDNMQPPTCHMAHLTSCSLHYTSCARASGGPGAGKHLALCRALPKCYRGCKSRQTAKAQIFLHSFQFLTEKENHRWFFQALAVNAQGSIFRREKKTGLKGRGEEGEGSF